MLSSGEKERARDDIRALIEASGMTGRLLRAEQENVVGFDGPLEPSEAVVKDSFPLEWHALSPEELKQIGADAVVHTLPDLDIRESDMVEYQQMRYRVTDVRPENLFGVITHLVVRLERQYRG